MCIVINLAAGPGAGKSTSAASIFANLKIKGKRAELVTEFAKDLTYEDRKATLKNQIYVFAKQYKRMELLRSQVDYIITDSPLFLSAMYSPENYFPSFNKLIIEVFNSFKNKTYFLSRKKVYQPYGRNQTLSEAQEIDERTLKYMQSNNIDFTTVTGDESGIKQICDQFN